MATTGRPIEDGGIISSAQEAVAYFAQWAEYEHTEVTGFLRNHGYRGDRDEAVNETLRRLGDAAPRWKANGRPMRRQSPGLLYRYLRYHVQEEQRRTGTRAWEVCHAAPPDEPSAPESPVEPLIAWMLKARGTLVAAMADLTGREAEGLAAALRGGAGTADRRAATRARIRLLPVAAATLAEVDPRAAEELSGPHVDRLLEYLGIDGEEIMHCSPPGGADGWRRRTTNASQHHAA